MQTRSKPFRRGEENERHPHVDVLQNRYWHARGPVFLGGRLIRLIEWRCLAGNAVFIGLDAVRALAATVMT